VGVKDGDTIQALHDGRAETVRLRAIDCPEKNQPWGKRAKEFTSKLVFGRHVEIVGDHQDRYGRTLAMVYCNGKCVNSELVRNGLAWRYKKSETPDYGLRMLEFKARALGIGLWSEKDPIYPGDWRKMRRFHAPAGIAEALDMLRRR
jgi:endonuclease YncB( thermonuclease family)